MLLRTENAQLAPAEMARIRPAELRTQILEEGESLARSYVDQQLSAIGDALRI
jgi:hypothetical protein